MISTNTVAIVNDVVPVPDTRAINAVIKFPQLTATDSGLLQVSAPNVDVGSARVATVEPFTLICNGARHQEPGCVKVSWAGPGDGPGMMIPTSGMNSGDPVVFFSVSVAIFSRSPQGRSPG
jgi:hypothetical protein